jgi:hypothetical protein
MFNEFEDGVVIADGRSGVRLSRAGDQTDLGYPTLIEVRAGPFVGSVQDITVGSYAAFKRNLVTLYDSLTGTASLGSLEGVISLDLTGDGRGAIAVSVEVVAEHSPLIRLTFEFAIDQTYLPRIIRTLNDEFPST